MDLDKINRWLTLIASVGVLAGIVILVIEIGQNTEMMRTQINQNRAELAMMEAQSLYDSDHIPALLTKIRRGDDLFDEDRERYRHLFRAFNRNWDNQLHQFREGLLDDNIPRSMQQAITIEFADSDLAMDLWEQTKRAYSDEYIDFVDSVLTSEPQ